jgi:membrane protease subunit HflK
VIAKTASAIIFFGLILISFSRKSYRAPMHDLKTQAGLATGFLKTHQKTLVNLAAAILFVALYPFYTLQVPPGSQGMIMRFGEVVDKDLSPGLYFRLPSPITETVVVESSNIRQISIDESLGNFTVSGQRVNSYENSNTYLTADENVLLIKSVITYEIDDIYNYHFYSEQNDDLLMDIARQVLVSESIQLPIDEVFTKERGNLESRFRDQLKSKVKDLGQGFNVLDARLVYVHAPNRVHDAFRDVASALEDLQRELFLADGNAISMLNEARGNSETIKANAKISAVNSLANARGQAAAFKPLADVHQIYPYLTERRLQLEAQEKWLVLPKLYINGLKNSQGLDLWLDPNAADVVRFKFKD